MDFANLLFGGDPPAPQQAPSPAPAAPQAAPAAGGGFFDKIGNDPSWTNAMLFAGARLLQGQRPGQNGAGLIGDALAVGVTAQQMTQENMRQAGIQDAQVARQNRLADAQIESQQASTAATKQETSQKAELFPETKKKVSAEARRLAALGRKEEAQALLDEYKANPSRIAEQYQLDLDLDRSRINASNAAAAAAGATADFTRRRTQAADALLDDGQPSAVLHGTGKTGKSAAKERMAELEQYVRAANPEWDDQQVAKKVAEAFDPSKLKGENFQTLRLLAESGDTNQRKFALGELAKAVGFAEGGAPAPAKGKGGGKPPAAVIRYDKNGQRIQ